MVKEMKRLRDAARNITAMGKPRVTESSLPIQVLYNSKIELIRLNEFEANSVLQPIKFDISEDYTGVKTQKLVRLESVSAPKTYTLHVDLQRDKHARIYETQVENFQRAAKFKKKKPLLLTDFTKGATDNSGVKQFTEALHKRVYAKTQERSFNRKIYGRKKNKS